MIYNTKVQAKSKKSSQKLGGCPNIHDKHGKQSVWLTSEVFQFTVATSASAAIRGILVSELPAHYSSQECSQCGYIHTDNRISQSEFICQHCQHCHHTDNADHNAANIMALRGVRRTLSGTCAKKSPLQRIEAFSGG